MLFFNIILLMFNCVNVVFDRFAVRTMLLHSMFLQEGCLAYKPDTELSFMVQQLFLEK